MNYRSRIANFGGFLCLLGIFSSIVQIGGCEMRLLRPLNDQPPTTAWAVRIGLVILGAAIFAVASYHSPEQARAARADEALVMQGLAQDPHMSYLLRYVYQTFGATLAAQAGAPRVAHLLFGGPGGYGRIKDGASTAYALVETPSGRFIASYQFTTQYPPQHMADTMGTWDAMARY